MTPNASSVITTAILPVLLFTGCVSQSSLEEALEEITTNAHAAQGRELMEVCRCQTTETPVEGGRMTAQWFDEVIACCRAAIQHH